MSFPAFVRRWGRLALSVTAVPLFATASYGQVTVNEIFAQNEDVPLDGRTTDWVELFNSSGQAVNLAGYGLTDNNSTPLKWQFPANASIPASGYLVVILDSGQPASTTASELMNAGFGIKGTGDRIELYSPTSQLVDSVRFGPQAANYTIGRIPSGSGAFVLGAPTPGAGNVAQQVGDANALRINEWMASPTSGDDWFEVYNPGDLPVQLTGLYFTDSNDEPSPVAPLSYIGVGVNGFLQMIADNSTEGNEVDFGLGAGGDSISLFRTGGILIDGVQFAEQQRGVSEGRVPDGGTEIRALSPDTPGESNLLPYEGLIVSELLSHTDLPFEDAVEFQNVTAAAIDISGWYLSDSRNNLMRYRIPAGTVVPAGSYIVLYENAFNAPGDPNGFTFSAEGEAIYLSEATATGTLTGRLVSEEFEAAENGVSFGRHETSVAGDYKFVALESPTFGVSNPGSVEEFRTGNGQANTGPRVGPIVVNEIMYNPPPVIAGVDNIQDEYIELLNITGQTVPLYDPAHPGNAWRLQDAVDFSFPAGAALAPGAAALVVSFDPTDANLLNSFRAKYGVPENVQVFGPYLDKLGNGGDGVELYKPDAPDTTTGEVPYIRVDKVNYLDAAPWPAQADGTGQALQRTNPAAFGNDPANWTAAVPTPGRTAAAASPEITGINIDNSGVVLQFSAASGQAYTVQYRENLQPSTEWQTLTTVTPSSNSATVTDPAGAANNQRYYRVAAGTAE